MEGKSMASLKICLFGATGFVGSAIAECLESNGIEWVGISRFKNENSKIINLELNDLNSIRGILNSYPIVINAMGSFKPADFEQNPKVTIQRFWDSLQLFSQVLTSTPISRLIHISSGGTVYGETNGIPARECDKLTPISWYGIAKEIEESTLEKAALQGGFQYMCARVSNPFGNLKFCNHGFIDVLVNTIKNNGSFNTFANKNYSRDFIYSKDMASVIFSLINYQQREQIEIFNVGSGKSTKLHEIVSLAQEIVCDFNYKLERLDNDFDVVQSSLNVDKIKSLGINIEAFKSIDSYLHDTLQGINQKNV